MKRIFVILMLLCFVSCFSGILTNAQALDVNTLFTALKSELGSKVVADNGVNAAEQPIKKILGMGASLAEVKNVLLDFISKGFKGNNLSSLVSCVSDLMKNKEAIKGAAGFVFQAIQQASSMGLKGEDLVKKVQGIVGQKASLGILDKKGLGSLFSK
jgi:hypothetical protein